MGRWGSAESTRKYKQFLIEWAVREHSLIGYHGDQVTVKILAQLFLIWANENVGGGDYSNYKIISEVMVHLYADTLVEEFGPKCLITIQYYLEQSPKRYPRQYINKLINFSRTIFRWGVSQEIVPPLILYALKSVKPLYFGRTTAPESKPRQAVPDEVIERTILLLLPTVASMVQVQRLAGMRPGEVCKMRIGDIDRSQNIWLYRPDSWKGKWREHNRVIALGKQEQEMINPRLIGRKNGEYVFRPLDTIQEKKNKDALTRKTRVSSSKKTKMKRRKNKPERHFNCCYTTSAYNHNISRAIESANRHLDDKIPHWTPYQLRHTAITEVTDEEGLDAALAFAGQRTINVTQIYNHSDLSKTIQLAEKRSLKYEESQKKREMILKSGDTRDAVSLQQLSDDFEKTNLELALPNGLVIKFPSGTSVDSIAEFITKLNSCYQINDFCENLIEMNENAG